MVGNVVTATRDSTIGDVMRRMDIGGFRHMVIVDRKGYIDGIVSQKDLMRHFVLVLNSMTQAKVAF